jgi:hypothetical protein
MALPRWAKSKIEIPLPNRATPYSDKLEPKRPYPRRLKLDPTWNIPSTEHPLPNRAFPKMLKLLDKRAYVRTDSELARCE